MAEYRSSRTLYEVKEKGIINSRMAHITKDGDLVIESYDLDPDLKEMMGDSDYEKGLTVPRGKVEQVRILLGQEFGFIATDDRDAEVLDVLVTGFGGTIMAFRNIKEWLGSKGIPFDEWAY